jgi:hypothetical protein
VSGPLPQPRPRTSKRRLQTTAFWKARGWSHQDVIEDAPPSVGLREQNAIHPAT